MPITKSAKKALRGGQRKEIVNLKIKEAFKKAVREFKKKPTSKNLTKASSVLDKAAKKKVIHKNKASRLKSRLAKSLRKTKSNKNKISVSSKAS